LGHLPALLASEPKSGLVVGMGTAMTLGALSQHGLDRLDLVELEPRVLGAARLFAAENVGVLDRPELRIVYDDGYNFLHAERPLYDVITSDPIHPFVRGGSTLYSADYFARAARRLSKDGVFAHWLPLPNMGRGDFEMIIRNFSDVYPFARLYWNGGEDGLLVGRFVPWNDPAIDTAAFGRVSRSLATSNIESAEELASLAFADRDTLVRWAGEGPRSTIDLPLLEFSAPKAMHVWTLDENLMTLLGWRDGWAPKTNARHRREIAAAMRVLGELLPAQDPEATLRVLREWVGCTGRIRGCESRIVTGTLRKTLFGQAFQRGGQLVRKLEREALEASPDRIGLARKLLEYAHVLASPERAAERRAVELELERLAALASS
jgi:hypothetical protein